MGYDQLMRPQRAGQGAEYATLNPNAVSPAFLKTLLNCAIENDLWETEPGAVQMNTLPLLASPTVGTVVQFAPEPGVSRIIACGRNGTVWVSTDEGTTFTLLSSALQANRLIVPVTGGKEITGSLKKLFLFGGGTTLIIAGDATVDAGITTPIIPPTLALVIQSGAVNPGEHNYVYTFGNSVGETAPSGQGNITVNNPNAARVTVGVPVGPAGTTYRKVYRTKAAGDVTTLFLLTTLNDNTTLTYEDNTPDGSLGTKVAPVNNATSKIHTLSRPPADWREGNQPIGGFILEGRMAGFGNNNQQHGLYYSTREDHEDFLSSGSGFLPVFTGKGDGIKAGVYWRSQGWLLKSPRGIYRVDTSNIDPVQWQIHEHSDSVGCVGPMAITLIQGADDSQFYDDVIFISPDGSWHRMSKTGAYQVGDINASSISETTYGEFIRTNVDKARLPFCQLIYFDEIEEVWGGFTQLGATINKLRIKASLKRLPEFGIRFHHSNFPECEGLGLIINNDGSRTPITGGALGVVKRAYQKGYSDAGVQYQSVWETWDDNFQDLGEQYKVSMKNYHFLVLEGLSVGDWSMYVEVYIDGVLQPTLLTISMKGKGSQFILDQSRLDQQALGATKPLFVVTRLRGRGHRIRYRGYISTDGPVPVPDGIGYGQLWTHELAARANTAQPAASVFVDDLRVFAFHLFDGVVVNPMQYDVSVDGGQTFPTMNTTPYTPSGGDVVGARTIRLADGALRFLLLHNGSASISYCDDLLARPTTSTWNTVTPPGAAGAPVGFEVNALNVVVAYQDGASNLKLAYSTDGGANFTIAATGVAEVLSGIASYQWLASPTPGVWCLLSMQTGKIYRSTDSGANWGASVKTITPGDVLLSKIGAIFAVSATRLVAIYKGQVSVSDDAGVTWVDKQNLTLVAHSPLDIKQAGIGYVCNFGEIAGLPVLGGASAYLSAFGAETRGAAWRSTDLGDTWTIVNVVTGGSHGSASVLLTSMIGQAGRGVIDLWNLGAALRDSWYNPSPVPSLGPFFKIQQIQTGFSLGGFSGGNK